MALLLAGCTQSMLIVLASAGCAQTQHMLMLGTLEH